MYMVEYIHIKEFKIFILIFLSVTIILMTFLINNNFINQQHTIFGNAYSVTNDRQYLDSMQLSKFQTEIYRKSISQVLPPNIELKFNASIYLGNLITYKFREGYSFNELKEEERTFDIGDKLTALNVPLIQNLAKYISNNNIITIKNGSELNFIITDYPKILEPSSLSINAYKVKDDNENNNENILENPKVLGIANNENELKFNVGLHPGKYMFVATATWIPKTPDHAGGYVMYGYNIEIRI